MITRTLAVLGCLAVLPVSGAVAASYDLASLGFDPAAQDFDTNGGIIGVLPDGLTVTIDGFDAWGGVRSNFAVSSGLFYAEFAIADGTISLGLAPAGCCDTNSPGGGGGINIQWNGHIWGATGSEVFGYGWGSGPVVVGILLDADTGDFFLHTDGSWVNGAAPGGAPLYNIPSFIGADVQFVAVRGPGILAANFGASPFLYAPTGLTLQQDSGSESVAEPGMMVLIGLGLLAASATKRQKAL